MQRSCDVCGKPYEAQRSTSRYCSSGCRARRSQGAGVVVQLGADEPRADGAPGSVEAATRAELETAGRLDTALGQAAVVLAQRMDGGGRETGQALSSLAKSLRETMTEATRGAGKSSAVGSLKDELAARRARQGA